MTAPVRSSEPAAVHVALGARGYDVIIGRGALAGLGERSLVDHDRMFQAEQSVLIFQMIPYMTCCKTAGSRWP